MVHHKTLVAKTVQEMEDKSNAFEEECNKYGYKIINLYGTRIDFNTLVMIYVYESNEN